MRQLALLGSAIALGAGLAGPAMADIVIVDASAIQGTNVLFNGETQSATTVSGRSGTAQVDFTGVGGAILRTFGGQARIEGDLDASTPNPNDTVPVSGLSFALNNGGTFNNLEFNLFGGAGETARFTLTDDAGQTVTFDRVLGNGSNFFGFQGTGGQSIRNVAIEVTGSGFTDLRQIRLDAGSAIPEPAAWAMMLGGFALVGGMVRRRDRPVVTYS